MNAPSEITGNPSRAIGSRAGWLWLLLLNAAVFLWAHAGAFRDPMICSDDVRQQIYWMQQWTDPSLYPDDLQTAYARQYVPWGVQAVYRIAAVGMNPLTAAKCLTGLLFVALGVLVFGIGKNLAGRSAGWAMVSIYWLMPFFLDRISGGLSRSFAFPLLALFVWSWLERRPLVLVVTLCLQALLIPYLVPVTAGAMILLCLWPRKQDPDQKAQVIGVVLAIGLALSWRLALSGSEFGPLAGRKELTQAVFSSEGRYGFGVWPPSSIWTDLLIRPWEWIAPYREWGLWPGIIGTVIIGGLALFGLIRIRRQEVQRLLPLAAALAVASLGAYSLARLFPLKLFIPNRYLVYPVQLGWLILLGLSAHALWRLLGAGIRRWGPILVLAAAIAGGLRLQGTGLTDFSADRPVVAAVRELPTTDLIAGPPALMDNVLTFGQHKVLVSFELAHPWMTGYWNRIEPRLQDFFAAYYSGNIQKIRQFCARYHVDWIVVDRRDFPVEAGGLAESPDHPKAPDFLRGRPFFTPFDRQIEELMKNKKSFAILDPQPFPVRAIDESHFLVDVRSAR